MRLRIATILKARKLTPYALAHMSAGRISLSAAYRLAESSGEFRCLRADVMDALCEILRVQPGDLFDPVALPKRPKR